MTRPRRSQRSAAGRELVVTAELAHLGKEAKRRAGAVREEEDGTYSWRAA